jgi:hypothetical protein
MVELGKKPRPDIIDLRVMDVSGNDPDAKFNPLIPGTRGPQVLLVQIPLNTPIKLLKEMIGCRIHGFPPGWTDSDADNELESGANTGQDSTSINFSFAGLRYRLRRTNWQDEAGDLLLEKGDKGELLTIASVGLQTDTLLLFEEGDLPVRGMQTFTLFLWIPSPSYDKTESEISQSTVASFSSEVGHTVAAKSGVNGKDKTKMDDDEVIVMDTPPKPRIIEIIENQRLQHLLRIGSIKCHEDKTLLDLQQVVYESLLSSSSGLNSFYHL